MALGAGLQAVALNPDQAQVEAAIARGVQHKDQPEKLFEGYEFGERGVAVNGVVLTKLFQISHRAAMLAKEGQPTPPSAFKDLIEQKYLMFQLYLLADDPKSLETVSVSLRQGLQTADAAKVLTDPVEKLMCNGSECLYKRDVYAAFWNSAIDPERLAVIVVDYGAQKVDFALQLGQFH